MKDEKVLSVFIHSLHSLLITQVVSLLFVERFVRSPSAPFSTFVVLATLSIKWEGSSKVLMACRLFVCLYLCVCVYVSMCVRVCVFKCVLCVYRYLDGSVVGDQSQGFSVGDHG